MVKFRNLRQAFCYVLNTANDDMQKSMAKMSQKELEKVFDKAFVFAKEIYKHNRYCHRMMKAFRIAGTHLRKHGQDDSHIEQRIQKFLDGHQMNYSPM